MYEYNPNDDATSIEKMVYHLRDEHRLKMLCDYAYIHDCVTKGFTFICHEVWEEEIREHAEEFEIKVDGILISN